MQQQTLVGQAKSLAGCSVNSRSKVRGRTGLERLATATALLFSEDPTQSSHLSPQSSQTVRGRRAFQRANAARKVCGEWFLLHSFV